MMDFQWVMFLVIGVVLAVVVFFAHRAAQRRKRRWALWAQAREWRFIERWPEMVRAFRGGPFGRGSSREASVGFEGTFDGLPVAGFHYNYSTGSGKNRTTHFYHVLLVRIPRAGFPELTLSKENWATRTFNNDIEFEDAEFNHEWNVNAPSPRFAHDVVHPRMIEFLKSGAVPPFERIWFERDAILLSRSGHIDTPHVDTYLRLLTRMASLLPRFLLEEVGAVPFQVTWAGPGISREEQARRLAQLDQRDEA